MGVEGGLLGIAPEILLFLAWKRPEGNAHQRFDHVSQQTNIGYVGVSPPIESERERETERQRLDREREIDIYI